MRLICVDWIQRIVIPGDMYEVILTDPSPFLTQRLPEPQALSIAVPHYPSLKNLRVAFFDFERDLELINYLD